MHTFSQKDAPASREHKFKNITFDIWVHQSTGICPETGETTYDEVEETVTIDFIAYYQEEETSLDPDCDIEITCESVRISSPIFGLDQDEDLILQCIDYANDNIDVLMDYEQDCE
jgi:hypothetical protein